MLELSPGNKRVKCGGCKQFQPVMTRGEGAKELVCAACLHVISDTKADIDAAYELGIVKGHISSADFRRPGKGLADESDYFVGNVKVHTRPAHVEETR